MSNLGLSQLLKVLGFRGPYLTPDNRLTLLDTAPIEAQSCLSYQHAPTLSLVARNILFVREHKVFDARGAPKAVSLQGTRRKGSSRIP